jgi:hypothetical protein
MAAAAAVPDLSTAGARDLQHGASAADVADAVEQVQRGEGDRRSGVLAAS